MKWHVAYVLLMIPLLIPATTANALAVRWLVTEGGNGHFYEAVAVPDGITWFEAYEAASLAGGYLVAITSQEEEDFVENLVDDLCWSPGGYGPWIGGYQLPGSPEPGGGWQWVTREPLTYTNWGQDQPNDKWGTEHCIHLASYDEERRSVIWNDLTPNVKNIRGYVVEFSGRCQGALVGDLNDDCRIDLLDFAIMVGNWLNECNLTPNDAGSMAR